MEPAATVEMYVDAWKATSPISIHDDGFKVLDLLRGRKRRTVIAALIEHVQEDISNLEDASTSPTEARSGMLRKLNVYSMGGRQTRDARWLWKELQKGADQARRNQISLWLEHTQPDSPLVKMLADAKDANLRLIVMGALSSHPTPDNRAVLDRLLEDANAEVRSAAEEVQRELNSLAADDPMKYASGGPGRDRAGGGNP